MIFPHTHLLAISSCIALFSTLCACEHSTQETDNTAQNKSFLTLEENHCDGDVLTYIVTRFGKTLETETTPFQAEEHRLVPFHADEFQSCVPDFIHAPSSSKWDDKTNKQGQRILRSNSSESLVIQYTYHTNGALRSWSLDLTPETRNDPENTLQQTFRSDSTIVSMNLGVKCAVRLPSMPPTQTPNLVFSTLTFDEQERALSATLRSPSQNRTSWRARYTYSDDSFEPSFFTLTNSRRDTFTYAFKYNQDPMHPTVSVSHSDTPTHSASINLCATHTSPPRPPTNPLPPSCDPNTPYDIACTVAVDYGYSCSHDRRSGSPSASLDGVIDSYIPNGPSGSFASLSQHTPPDSIRNFSVDIPDPNTDGVTLDEQGRVIRFARDNEFELFEKTYTYHAENGALHRYTSTQDSGFGDRYTTRASFFENSQIASYSYTSDEGSTEYYSSQSASFYRDGQAASYYTGSGFRYPKYIEHASWNEDGNLLRRSSQDEVAPWSQDIEITYDALGRRATLQANCGSVFDHYLGNLYTFIYAQDSP